MAFAAARATKEAITGARDFAIVFAVALAARLAFVIPIHPLPVSDFAWYYERALGLLNGADYTVHGLPTALWPPGWPYFLAGVMWLFGNSVPAIEVVQSILGALTAGVALLIGRALFGRACGLASGLAFAVLPSAVEWSATLASEPLYTLLWALSTYWWITRAPKQVGWYALSGAVLGAAALVRPSALLFGVILIAYVLCTAVERKYAARWAIAIGATVLCTALVVLPTIVRNYRVFGTLVVISNNGGISLYEANNPRSTGGYNALDDPQLERMWMNPRTEARADKLASAYAMQYMRTHPKRELVLALKKIKALYSSDALAIRFTLRSRHFQEPQSPPPSDRLATAVLLLNTAIYFAVMALAIAGIALCLLRSFAGPVNPRWRLLLGMILYNTLIFAVMGGIDRYRFPTMPYFCVFAGVAVSAALAYARGAVAASTAERLRPTT